MEPSTPTNNSPKSPINTSLITSQVNQTPDVSIKIQQNNPKWNKFSLIAVIIILTWTVIFIFGNIFDLHISLPFGLGVLSSIAPLVALLFALISRRQINKTGEKGKAQSDFIVLFIGGFALLIIFFLIVIFLSYL